MRLCNYTLSPTRINNAKPKGKLYKLTDGGGLFIEDSAAGLKTWRYQYRFGGVRREVTIGKFPEVGVADVQRRRPGTAPQRAVPITRDIVCRGR